MGDLTPQGTKQTFSFGNWKRASLNEMVKKWGIERFYISCNFS